MPRYQRRYSPTSSILVNNAGILIQRPLIMSDFDSFWKQIEVNFKGVRLLSGLSVGGVITRA